MAKSAQDVLQKYQRNVAAAGPSYQAGVQSPKASWSQEYTKAADRMAANFQQAIAEGKPQAAVRSLGDEGWKQKTLAKADRYAASSGRAAEGYAQVVQRVIDAGEAGRAAANSIPKGDFEASMQRVRANAQTIRDRWK